MRLPPSFPRLIATVITGAAVLLTAAARAANPDSLEAGFASPPAEARPLVWWHWVNGNITKHGIEADLADMKRVGIAGAQMFDVSIYLPPGPVRYGTDRWHEHVQHAITTAAKLGLEFYAMNTPGWSASGGPWVTPERSMKQLVWSETTFTGGRQVIAMLPPPLAKLGFYRDATVLAVPADPVIAVPVRVSAPAATKVAALTDGDLGTSARFEANGGESGVVRFDFEQPVELSRLVLTYAGDDPALTTFRGSLEGSVTGTSFAKIHDFNVADHQGPAPQLIISFKPARAKTVRLTLSVLRGGKRAAFSLAEVLLDHPPRLADWTQKTKMAEATLKRPAASGTAPAGAIPRAQVLDLTSNLDAATGRFTGVLPPGRWTILRFGFTSTGSQNHPAVPEGHGLEIDKLDADAVSFYFDRALGRMIREAGPRAGSTFKGILFDSFEGGPQNWTATLPAQFAALRGYDLVPCLPALTGRVIESATFTECVLSDFRAAIEDLIAKRYFGTMQRRAHEHGLVTYAEAQGGPLNPVSSGEYVDVPMNEFWMPDATPRLPRIKLVASVANVLGRRIVAAESFTATPENGRWQAMPARLKVAGDGAWAAGINRFILHHYTHQPTDDGPGFGLGRYGTNFGRLNSWWPLAMDWISYVSRSQFLLQQGRTVADICFLQNEDHGYAYPAAMVEVPAGYDFDICYPRHLAAMSWRDGVFSLPTGPEYRLLALPENWAADLPTLRRLREFARAGAPIIGPAPVAPAGVRDYDANAEYSALVAELWGGGNAGGGLIRRLPLADALRGRRFAPDIAWPGRSGAGEFRYIHRRTAGAEIYFVFNQSDEPAAGDFTFRTLHRRPEIWNAITGTHDDAPVFRPTAEGTVVPLQLEPNGSCFVVFRRPQPARWIESASPAEVAAQGGQLLGRGPVTLRYSDGKTTTTPAATPPAEVAIGGPWRVAFVDGRGAPTLAIFPKLTSWTERPEPGIRYYSGVAEYRTTFVVPAANLRAGTTALLDLGRVADLGEVRINGERVRTLWQPPFRVEVTRWLRAGENSLEVRVANRWINRLIGDESIPTDLTYQKPGTNKFTDGRLEQLPAWLYDRTKIAERQRFSFATWKHYTADSPLVPAGLLGPVRVEWRVVITP